MTGFSKATRQLVKSRSRKLCEVQMACTGAAAVHKHHRRNRGSGGSKLVEVNSASNALDVCSACHDFVGLYPNVAKDKGWSVSYWKNPAAIPVWYRRDRWAYLDDEGGITFIEPKTRGA